MGLLSEFREFAVKGNAIDLAVGVIIGAAFGKVVTSIVEDLVMPPLGRITGNLNFSDKFIALDGKEYASLAAAKQAGAAVVAYGNFIGIAIQFLITAFAVFLLVKLINEARERTNMAVAAPADPADVVLLGEIRDLLKARG